MEFDTCSRVVFSDESICQPSYAAQDMVVCLTCSECCFAPGVTQRVREMNAFVCQCKANGHECLFSQASACPELKPFVGPRLTQIFQATVGQKHIMGTISSHLSMARVFEDDEAKFEALEVLPPQVLEIAFPQVGERDDEKLFVALLAWFKTFFSWVGQEGFPCVHCKGVKTRVFGRTFPTLEEKKWAVGLFGCLLVFVCVLNIF
jgi:hypothetical protein